MSHVIICLHALKGKKYQGGAVDKKGSRCTMLVCLGVLACVCAYLFWLAVYLFVNANIVQYI